MSPYRRVVAVAVVVLLVSSFSEAKHETWVEIRSANFVVVSNAGEKQARKAALQFEQIREVFRESLQGVTKSPSPVVTILAVKDQGSMRELLPEYWASGHAHPAGIFFAGLNQYFAAVELDAQGSNPYETFYHEYYHSISTPYQPEWPVWLSEGLAEVYGHTKIDEKSAIMGEPDAGLLQELQSSPFIPLNVLFRVDHSSPYYNEASRTSMFYAESWALTHYLLLGDRMAHRDILDSYLLALLKGKSQDEALAAFGDLNKLQKDLLAYIRQSKFFGLVLPPVKIADEELKVRTLSEAEADAYRGGFAAVRGQTKDATAILHEALQLDPKVALAHQYLAMAEFLGGQREKAVESASQAVTLDPKNYYSRYLRAFLATTASGIMSSDPHAEEDLRQAIALEPEFSPPYALLAVYLAFQNENLEEALGYARKAVSLQPGSSSYQLSLAQVLLRMNKYSEAGTALARASAWARNPQEKANAESFSSYMQQVRQFQSMAQPRSAVDDSAHAGTSAPPQLRTRTTGLSPVPIGAVHLQMNVMVLNGPQASGLRSYIGEVLGGLQSGLLNPAATATVKQPRNLSVEFAIMKDGTVSNIKIVSSSGDAALDQSARDAIAKASPVKAMPADWNAKTLSLRMNLAYSQEAVDAH
ncbi:MAG: TonB family protein [Terriglobales bacterium]